MRGDARDLEDGLYVRCPSCERRLAKPYPPSEAPYLAFDEHRREGGGRGSAPRCRIAFEVRPNGTYRGRELGWGEKMETPARRFIELRRGGGGFRAMGMAR